MYKGYKWELPLMSIVITFKGIAKYFHNFLNSMKFFFCAEVIHNYSKLPCNAELLHTPMMGSQESLLFYVSIERGLKMLLNRNLYQCGVIGISVYEYMST